MVLFAVFDFMLSYCLSGCFRVLSLPTLTLSVFLLSLLTFSHCLCFLFHILCVYIACIMYGCNHRMFANIACDNRLCWVGPVQAVLLNKSALKFVTRPVMLEWWQSGNSLINPFGAHVSFPVMSVIVCCVKIVLTCFKVPFSLPLLTLYLNSRQGFTKRT